LADRSWDGWSRPRTDLVLVSSNLHGFERHAS
jgi:hypothetical protein